MKKILFYLVAMFSTITLFSYAQAVPPLTCEYIQEMKEAKDIQVVSYVCSDNADCEALVKKQITYALTVDDEGSASELSDQEYDTLVQATRPKTLQVLVGDIVLDGVRVNGDDMTYDVYFETGTVNESPVFNADGEILFGDDTCVQDWIEFY